MTCRPLKPSDIPILKRRAEASGFPYPQFDDPLIEAFIVVADSDDNPIFALAVKRLIEGYGYFDSSRSAVVQAAALRLAHEQIPKMLRDKMYTSIEVFIPPQIAKRFGRILERTFGWVKNWPSWVRHF